MKRSTKIEILVVVLIVVLPACGWLASEIRWARLNNPDGKFANVAEYIAHGRQPSRVTKVNRISLQTLDDGGTLKLFRRIDGEAPVPLIEHVNTLTFTYRLTDGTETRNPPSPEDIQEIIVSIDASLRSGWGLDDRSVVTRTSVRPRST